MLNDLLSFLYLLQTKMNLMSDTQISSENAGTEDASQEIDITTLIKSKFPKKNPRPEFVENLKSQVINNEEEN